MTRTDMFPGEYPSSTTYPGTFVDATGGFTLPLTLSITVGPQLDSGLTLDDGELFAVSAVTGDVYAVVFAADELHYVRVAHAELFAVNVSADVLARQTHDAKLPFDPVLLDGQELFAVRAASPELFAASSVSGPLFVVDGMPGELWAVAQEAAALHTVTVSHRVVIR